MSVPHKISNFIGVFVPFAGFLASVYLCWGDFITGRDLGILAVGYFFTCLGISIGFHRLLTHRSYETYSGIRYLLAILGSMAVEGPPNVWVADHRKHHNFSDQEGDPHSPHAGFGKSLADAIHGLWHAHVGWLFVNEARADRAKYAKDLEADKGMVLISKLFLPLVAFSLVLPFIVGYVLTGSIGAGLQAMFWGGVIRIFLLHHVTFSVNSICHFFGKRRFQTSDESRNVWWLSVLSLGESWHHNHHAFPSSAFHGLKSWEVDISAWILRGLEKAGLIWKVVRISPELQARKQVAA